MRSIRWSRKALVDLDEALSHIAGENPFAAQAVAERILISAHHLAAVPYPGAPGTVPTTRHWVVSRTPYLLVYRVSDEVIEVLRVWHSRRNWIGGVEESVVERNEMPCFREEEPALD